MALGSRNKLVAPMFETEVFGSKCTVLKKVLVTLLGLFGARRSDSATREMCSPCYASAAKGITWTNSIAPQNA